MGRGDWKYRVSIDSGIVSSDEKKVQSHEVKSYSQEFSVNSRLQVHLTAKPPKERADWIGCTFGLGGVDSSTSTEVAAPFLSRLELCSDCVEAKPEVLV
jgi:hypothetical protein